MATVTPVYTTLTHNRATAKIVGTNIADTSTIALSALTVTGQTASSPLVGITSVSYSLSATGNATISRNGIVIFNLFGDGTLSFGSHEQQGQNIVVTFGSSAGGTIIIELSKSAGFSAINP